MNECLQFSSIVGAFCACLLVENIYLLFVRVYVWVDGNNNVTILHFRFVILVRFLFVFCLSCSQRCKEAPSSFHKYFFTILSLHLFIVFPPQKKKCWNNILQLSSGFPQSNNNLILIAYNPGFMESKQKQQHTTLPAIIINLLQKYLCVNWKVCGKGGIFAEMFVWRWCVGNNLLKLPQKVIIRIKRISSPMHKAFESFLL